MVKISLVNATAILVAVVAMMRLGIYRNASKNTIEKVKTAETPANAF